ncbi:MAG: hypothetical protein M9953_09855 [Thermomicrobiales bacterium]|nr:hypothetical protein [Thermomicrobiales bacterium]MCO5219457.1 hypothetical protein [Thermomicrobiales bacterium]MCO5225632.1 hypothetical protein [Thermomicrobiales bacterium]MCO5228429.1 hypothetical protein [Thermomicrobiales bacterium]
MNQQSQTRYIVERKLDNIVGELSVAYASGTVSHLLAVRHDDGVAISSTISGDGKAFTFEVTLEGFFDTPAVMRGTAVRRNDQVLQIQDAEWLDTPLPDVEAPMECCGKIAGNEKFEKEMTNWKPAKSVKGKKPRGLDSIQQFLAEWQDVIYQDFAAAPPAEDYPNPNPVLPDFLAGLACLASCAAMFAAGVAGLAIAMGSSGGLATPAVIGASAALLLGLAACEISCILSFMSSQLRGTPGRRS